MSFEEVYDNSYERVLSKKIDGKGVFDSFYESFIESSDEVRERFKNTDMELQKGMLKKSFYNLLVFYGSNHADDYIKKIAVAHNQAHLNIRPALYDLWLDVLIKTLSKYDEKFNDEVELAWRLVLAPGITYMKFKWSHMDDEDE